MSESTSSTSQEWFYEQAYFHKHDLALREDPEYLKWLDDRQKADIAAQIEETL